MAIFFAICTCQNCPYFLVLQFLPLPQVQPTLLHHLLTTDPDLPPIPYILQPPPCLTNSGHLSLYVVMNMQLATKIGRQATIVGIQRVKRDKKNNNFEIPEWMQLWTYNRESRECCLIANMHVGAILKDDVFMLQPPLLLRMLITNMRDINKFICPPNVSTRTCACPMTTGKLFVDTLCTTPCRVVHPLPLFAL